MDASVGDIERVLSSTNIRGMNNPFNPSSSALRDEEDESDPFLVMEEQDTLRWRNLFPKGKGQVKDVFHTKAHALGLREVMWRSLQSPGVLPLTTDIMPTANDLANFYSVNFYTLTLPEDYTDEEYNDDTDLLKEMVAQRLSQDFQLVSNTAAGHMHRSSGSPGRALTSSPSRVLASEADSLGTSSTITLSLGHQLHVLRYDSLSRNIEVQRYVHVSRTSPSAELRQKYCYLMWDDLEGHASLGSYEFRSSLVFYNWNYVDQVVCGYDDDLSGTVRYRRQRFTIFPPSSNYAAPKLDSSDAEVSCIMEGGVTDWAIAPMSPEVVETRSASFLKFVKWLNEKTLNDEKVRVMIEENVKAEAGARTRFAKVRLKSANSGRFEWLNIRYDTAFSPSQCYHLEVRWMVASGAAVGDFLSAMRRKAKQYGLDMQQVPEYCRSTARGYSARVPHPFIPPKHVHLRYPLKHHPCLYKLLRDALIYRHEFLVDSVYIRRGRGIKRDTTQWYSLVHATGAAYVHFSASGIEFVANQSAGNDAMRSRSGPREFLSSASPVVSITPPPLVASAAIKESAPQSCVGAAEMLRCVRSTCSSIQVAYSIIDELITDISMV